MGSPETYNIRTATPSDTTTMAYIEMRAQFARGIELTEQQVHTEALRIIKLLRLSTTWSGIATSEADESVAFIFGYPRLKEELPNDHHLDTIMTLPAHQRNGIASDLIDIALLNAARLGASTVNLWTDIDNTVARPFYEKKGFAITDRERPHPWIPNRAQVEYLARLSTAL